MGWYIKLQRDSIKSGNLGQSIGNQPINETLLHLSIQNNYKTTVSFESSKHLIQIYFDE